MTDTDTFGLLALVIAASNVITAVVAAFTAVVALGTRKQARLTELNTNSMREALVISAEAAAHAAGKEEARIEGEEKAARLVERDMETTVAHALGVTEGEANEKTKTGE